MPSTGWPDASTGTGRTSWAKSTGASPNCTVANTAVTDATRGSGPAIWNAAGRRLVREARLHRQEALDAPLQADRDARRIHADHRHALVGDRDHDRRGL